MPIRTAQSAPAVKTTYSFDGNGPPGLAIPSQANAATTANEPRRTIVAKIASACLIAVFVWRFSENGPSQELAEAAAFVDRGNAQAAKDRFIDPPCRYRAVVELLDFIGEDPGSCDMVFVVDCTSSPALTLVRVCDLLNVPPSCACARVLALRFGPLPWFT